MKKFNHLYKKLQKLESQKKNFDSIENISFIQFLRYKNVVIQKRKVKALMKKNMKSAQDIIEWYKRYTSMLLQNNKINCRRHCKLKQKAEFKRDLKLYRLGFIEKKPLRPLVQKIHFAFKKTLSPLFNFFTKTQQRFNNFKSNFIPKKINKIALNTAKVTIKGYRKFKSDCSFIKKHLTSNDLVKYMRNVYEEAILQVNFEEIHNKNQCSQNQDKKNQYVESLKFNVGTSFEPYRRSNHFNPKNNHPEFNL